MSMKKGTGIETEGARGSKGEGEYKQSVGRGGGHGGMGVYKNPPTLPTLPYLSTTE
ncbi:MAG: hypothetical protein F6K36_26595 [Symploca sp. SIO3C6]|nr:hypothetical protein [Symploca sp. SIO3C6]